MPAHLEQLSEGSAPPACTAAWTSCSCSSCSLKESNKLLIRLSHWDYLGGAFASIEAKCTGNGSSWYGSVLKPFMRRSLGGVHQ